MDCLRKHIAIVPQDSVLFHNSIFHNINYGNLQASNNQVIQAAKMAELHDSILVRFEQNTGCLKKSERNGCITKMVHI